MPCLVSHKYPFKIYYFSHPLTQCYALVIYRIISYLFECNVVFSNPWNHSAKNKHIVVTYTNVENRELEVIRDLVDMFKLKVTISWKNSVTHLILKTNADKRCIRTKKFMNALLMNCFIISLEWAKDCITSKTLLPEVYDFYTVLIL